MALYEPHGRSLKEMSKGMYEHKMKFAEGWESSNPSVGGREGGEGGEGGGMNIFWRNTIYIFYFTITVRSIIILSLASERNASRRRRRGLQLSLLLPRKSQSTLNAYFYSVMRA